MAGRPSKPMRPARAPTSVALMPEDISHRYRISDVTRRRWEAKGKLPPRDFFINGEAKGWTLEAILRAERGETTA